MLLILILGVVLETMVRAELEYNYALLILNIELLIIGISVCIETIFFVRLQKTVFEGDFEVEQKFFVRSMLAILAVYILRFGSTVCLMMFKD